MAEGAKPASEGRLPLADVKILDLSHFQAGPVGSQMLGDMGADVIKIEPPEGEPNRRGGSHAVGGQTTSFLFKNRNKRGITVNLRSEEGQEIIHRLAKVCDVALENFRPGVADRLGIGYKTLSQINPKLIYCSISAFGQSGPSSHKPGFDPIVQGAGGAMSLTGPKDGPPMMVGAPIADQSSGMTAAFAIMVALVERDLSGKGQKIEIAMLDTTISLLGPAASAYLLTGIIPRRLGPARDHTPVIYQALKTKDGYITVAAHMRHFWRAFCEAIGHPDLIDDPRFAKDQERIEHREELIAIVEEALSQHPCSHWLKVLEKAGVPSGPVYSVDQLFNDPQLLANDMVISVPHPTIGDLKMVGIPPKFSRTPGRARLAPPLVGQHTEEVLQELGYTLDQIQELKQKGAI